MDARLLEMLSQIAKGIASQFGPNCEVVVHEISEKSAYSSIVAIENGHVSGRKVGDGPSHVVLEQIGHDDDQVSDQLCYLTRTKDGKTLKSSSVYIHDEHGKVAAILGINYDISMMQMFENTLHEFNSVDAQTRKEPERITEVKAQLTAFTTGRLHELDNELDTLTDVAQSIRDTLIDEPPFSVREGGFIRKGYNAEVDRLHEILSGGKGLLADIETREKEKTGIRTLKIGYNKVFGYYIEVSNSFKDLVPDTYIRKQTLVNGERYITEELKEYEEKILGAEEKMLQLEQRIYAELLASICGSLQPLLQGTAENVTADRSVPVECVIHLGERLSDPAISFDVRVPGTDPETQTLIANTLSTPETIDTQFAYLLLFNSFMSENSSMANSNLGSSVSANTGLEFVSNLVSSWLSFSGYNIVLGYRPKSETASDEFDFGLSKSLFNDRLFVEVEGNYLMDNKQAVNSSMSNFMGEAYITYLIDRAGTLKLKAFTQTIDRFDENQGLQETGIGVYFKEDFDNLRDLRRRIRG